MPSETFGSHEHGGHQTLNPPKTLDDEKEANSIVYDDLFQNGQLNYASSLPIYITPVSVFEYSTVVRSHHVRTADRDLEGT